MSNSEIIAAVLVYEKNSENDEDVSFENIEGTPKNHTVKDKKLSKPPSGILNKMLNPTENSLAVLNRKILEANSQVKNVNLCGHQTCLSINRLWHELCDMLRRLVGTTAPGHHDCSIQE
ncbi:uncharacterized protein TNCV_3167511 [Trichonephila clavipes]|uniref:Uncharacterized protein n=1 Tax=Trichonephila clavipes TaxID=2585209 RepID=A0A8X6RA46_TRICX|nr:uncharacterized protein TNCV_3167511 [Trichonephila clavipes]